MQTLNVNAKERGNKPWLVRTLQFKNGISNITSNAKRGNVRQPERNVTVFIFVAAWYVLTFQLHKTKSGRYDLKQWNINFLKNVCYFFKNATGLDFFSFFFLFFLWFYDTTKILMVLVINSFRYLKNVSKHIKFTRRRQIRVLSFDNRFHLMTLLHSC